MSLDLEKKVLLNEAATGQNKSFICIVYMVIIVLTTDGYR